MFINNIKIYKFLALHLKIHYRFLIPVIMMVQQRIMFENGNMLVKDFSKFIHAVIVNWRLHKKFIGWSKFFVVFNFYVAKVLCHQHYKFRLLSHKDV